MSKERQNQFIKCVEDAEKTLSSDFNITNKKTAITGFVTHVTYSFGQGLVELLFGPPEYRIEIFISVKGSDGNLARYDLAKLISIPCLRNWAVNNKPRFNSGDKIRAEMEWNVFFLREIKKLSEFQSLIS